MRWSVAAAPRRSPLGQVSMVPPTGRPSPVPPELRAEIDRAIDEHGAAFAEWLNAEEAWNRLWETARGAGEELPPGVVGVNPAFEDAYARAWTASQRVDRARARLRRLQARASAIERISAGRFHGVTRRPFGPAVPTVPGTLAPVPWIETPVVPAPVLAVPAPFRRSRFPLSLVPGLSPIPVPIPFMSGRR